jgi:catechol 2,3-dioxygenase-like lactoylglutathione lyase family enzyme
MLLRVWDMSFTVSDLARAVRFYEDVLGLHKKCEFSSYAGFDCGGVEIGLVPGRQAEPSPESPRVDFLVDDIGAVHRRLRDNGVAFVKEPESTLWGGRIAQFRDPDGHVLQLVQIDWPAYLRACAS